MSTPQVAIVSPETWKGMRNKNGFHSIPASTTSLKVFLDGHFSGANIVCEKDIQKGVSKQIAHRCDALDTKTLPQYTLVIAVIKLEKGNNYIIAYLHGKQ